MQRWLCPSRLAEAVTEIDLEQLWEQGVRGLILDLDNTLVRWNRSELAPAVRAWVEAAKARGMRLCIVSNAFGGARVKRVAAELGIGSVVRGGKPFPRAFRKGMRMLATGPGETCAIGDQVFTDMLGANRLGLETILVAPMHPRESPHTRVVRLLEGPLRRRWRSRVSGFGNGREALGEEAKRRNGQRSESRD